MPSVLRVRLGPLCALACVLSVSACGVPIDASPSAIAKSNVPFDLLDQYPTTTTSSTAPAPVEVTVDLFLVAPNGHLTGVTRDVAFPAPLSAILGALVDGPTTTESAEGLWSAVPAQTIVMSATISGGIATLDLGGTFAQLVGPAQIQAVAQMVFTATAIPGVSSVAFELSGQQVDVPVADGAQVPIATRAQFASIAP